LNPGPPAPQAGVIIRTRRRAPDTGLCYKYETETIKTLLTMQSNGLKEGTLRAVKYQLKYLDKNPDLKNREEVQTFIASMKQANSYKQCMVKAYNYFADVNGINRIETHFKYRRKIPLIPSSENVNRIISASSKKYATIFRILDETGLEEQELRNVTRNDIDIEKGIINAQGWKNHKSRSFKLKLETSEMLRQYLFKYREFQPFPETQYMGEIWEEQETN
jgi:integrase